MDMRKIVAEFKKYGQIEISMSDFGHFVAMCQVWEGIHPDIAIRYESKGTYLMTY